MNVVEWLLYAAASELQRSDDATWLALPQRTRAACIWVNTWGHRRVTPYPDILSLVLALGQCKFNSEPGKMDS